MTNHLERRRRGGTEPSETGGATNDDHSVDVFPVSFKRLLDGLEGLANEVVVGLLEVGAGESLGEVVAASKVDLELGDIEGRVCSA